MPLGQTALFEAPLAGTLDLGRQLDKWEQQLLRGQVVSVLEGILLFHLANATRTISLRELQRRFADADAQLVLAHPSEVTDYISDLSLKGRRFCRRLGPQPTLVRFMVSATTGLLTRLPAELITRISPQRPLGFWLRGGGILQELAERVDFPLSAHAQVMASAEVVEDGKFSMPRSLVWKDEVACDAHGVPLPHEEQRQLTACTVLFVCTGNTCRSPMAEVLFKHKLAQRLGCAVGDLPQQGWRVLSAGLAAAPGCPASEGAQAAAMARGLNLKDHRSQPLSLGLLSEADYVFAMTRGHWVSLAGKPLSADTRLELLAAEGFDIMDPYGGDQEQYDACAAVIDAQLELRLVELAEGLTPAARPAPEGP